MGGGDLEGQTAFVTGAGRGVGRAIAEAIARAGASVGMCARTESQVRRVAASIEAHGGRSIALALDVTDRANVEQAVARIEDELGPISLLVNNAGTLDAVGPLWEIDPEVWWRDIEVHVRGTFLCTHAVLSRMVHRRAGRIVNVLGMLGQTGDPHASAYAAAKAAVFRLTETLANELGSHGIVVFSISPGPVRTDMTTRFISNPEMRKWIPAFAQMPESEWVSSDDGAQLIVRLARGDADVLTGRFIHVANDLDHLVADADEIKSHNRLVMRLVGP